MNTHKIVAVAQDLRLRTSGYSDAMGGQCAEVSARSAAVHVRTRRTTRGP